MGESRIELGLGAAKVAFTDVGMILGVVIFAVVLLLIAFFVSLGKSRDVKIEDTEEYLAEKEEAGV